MKIFYAFLLICASFPAFAQYSYKFYPNQHFEDYTAPPKPDYNNADHWLALPNKVDAADKTPPGLEDQQANAEVDVFFVYPTIYTGGKGQDQWNADINDAELNKDIDEGTIQYQATIFNASAKIYIPRYRQAHLHAYYTEEDGQEIDAAKALDFAYQDVKAAFKYYMANYNNGRPFIIASHSQGTTHTGRLLLEEIDGKPIKEQLVAAYLVGIPIPRDSLKTIPPCESADETGCFVSWRTFLRGHTATWDKPGVDYVNTNPLTWTTSEEYAPDSLNIGGVLRNYNKVRENVCDAQVHDNVLWINSPKVFGAKLLGMKNYHIADYNLFYSNVRENVALRVATYLKERE